jgi:hypothetical protein
MNIKVVGDKEVNKRLSNLRRYVVQVAGAPSRYLITQQTVNAAVEQAKKFYAAPSGKPHYPLRWKSQKQKVAVIIKLKKEGNLPYRRTGQLANAWEGEITDKGVEIANTAKSEGKFIAPFVIGAFQQPFHTDTGWTKRRASIERQIIKPITDDMMKRAKEGIADSKHG